MSEKYGHPRFYELLDEFAQTHSAKARDYSGTREPFANFRAASDFGVRPFIGVLIRMSDKWERIKSLVEQGGRGQVKDESLSDTLHDLAAYALIAMIMLEEEEQNANDKLVASFAVRRKFLGPIDEYGTQITARDLDGDSEC